jgi:hypothetical protein
VRCKGLNAMTSGVGCPDVPNHAWASGRSHLAFIEIVAMAPIGVITASIEQMDIEQNSQAGRKGKSEISRRHAAAPKNRQRP